MQNTLSDLQVICAFRQELMSHFVSSLALACRITIEIMNVQVMLNKMNSGRLQVTVVQSGQSTGTVMTYRSTDEVREVLTSLGLDDHSIEAKLQTLEEITSSELLKFPPSDIEPEILHANGFAAV